MKANPSSRFHGPSSESKGQPLPNYFSSDRIFTVRTSWHTTGCRLDERQVSEGLYDRWIRSLAPRWQFVR